MIDKSQFSRAILDGPEGNSDESLARIAIAKRRIQCNYIIAILSASDPTIHTSVPANFAAIEQLGLGLLSDPSTGVTPTLLAQMMALIVPQVSWWSVNGFSGPITITELIAAGNLF